MGDIAALMRPTSLRAETYSLDDYVNLLRSSGYGLITTMQGNQEPMSGDFLGLIAGAYQSNGVVFACLMTRFLLFSEARFQFQQMRGGRPGDLFGTPDLQILETPEPGMTTGDLLSTMLLDADLSGDWFGVRRPGRIKRLRPDWTIVVIGSPNDQYDAPGDDPDAEVAGYLYVPGGLYSGNDAVSFDRSEIAHFFPIKNPAAKYRGMALPTAVMREIRADSAATYHKLQFFSNAATPNLLVKFPATLPKDKAREWIDVFEQEHAGASNAYRTMYLGAGADATAIGKDFAEMEFAATQGKGETRIAAAMNAHPVVVALSEGMQGSSLNSGNFEAAKRLQADKMLRPNWRNAAGSLQTIVPAVPGTRLWYDDRDIPFLADNIKDAADVLFTQAQAMRHLGDGGWDHDAVVDAVTSGDLRRLANRHTGLVPVQLQPPGSVAALATFWPSSPNLPGVVIERGMSLLATDPIALAYPSLFRPEGVAA